MFRMTSVAAAFSVMLAACSSVPLASLAECPEAGTARYFGIPIASREEHRQARSFVPTRSDNCLLYVVRDRDWWTGASVRRVDLVLVPSGTPHFRLPADRRALPTVTNFPVLEIHDDVYAMLEVPAGVYTLYALSVNEYGLSYLRQFTDPDKPFAATHDVTCAAGRVRFLTVRDVGYFSTLAVTDLAPDIGKAQVLAGLRSSGLQASSTGGAFRDCNLKWQ